MSVSSWVIALLVRILGFGLLWWIITEGDVSVASYGLAAVALGVVVSLATWPPRPAAPRSWMPRGFAAARLAGWFLWRSAVGGADVARRSVGRPVDVDPGMLEYRWRMSSSAGRVAVINLLNLLPGSLAVELLEDRVRVHVIDVAMPVEDMLMTLEDRVAAVLPPG